MSNTADKGEKVFTGFGNKQAIGDLKGSIVSVEQGWMVNGKRRIITEKGMRAIDSGCRRLKEVCVCLCCVFVEFVIFLGWQHLSCI